VRGRWYPRLSQKIKRKPDPNVPLKKKMKKRLVIPTGAIREWYKTL
jgi:hypothetical protein